MGGLREDKEKDSLVWGRFPNGPSALSLLVPHSLLSPPTLSYSFPLLNTDNSKSSYRDAEAMPPN